MSINWPKPSHNHASEYQVSSWPWVTSSNVGTSAVYFDFGYVTRWVVISNETAASGSKDVYFGFTQNGVNGSNCFHLLPGQTAGPVEVKCTGLWVKGSNATTPVSIMAGLTGVNGSEFPNVTGSNGFSGVG